MSYLKLPERPMPAASRRHWFELLRRARTSDTPYDAAALYPYAAPDVRRLEARLFDGRRDRLLLASAGFVGPEVLARLALLADDDVLRVRLARNPATPGHALAQLWRSGASPRLRELLARHPHTPRRVQAEIAASAVEIDVLSALCESTGVAADILAAVGARRIDVLQRLLAVNLATGADTLEALWHDATEEAVRAQILLHPHCPGALLATLPATMLERRCLAQQGRTPAALLGELGSDREHVVRRAAAANPATPLAALVACCFDADVAVRRTVAARRDLSAALAACLIEDADAWVRRALARNPACPRALLERAAVDADPEVRRAAARHPACPADLLDRLGRDAVPWVQAAVAYRDDLPATVLRRLARSADIDVLAGVARNPGTAPSRLARLASHPSTDVRRAVILNRNAPRNVLCLLRQDGYALHRAMLADHPNLADADRWRMRDDPDPLVRFRVFSHFARRHGPPPQRPPMQGRHATAAPSPQPRHPLRENMETT